MRQVVAQGGRSQHIDPLDCAFFNAVHGICEQPVWACADLQPRTRKRGRRMAGYGALGSRIQLDHAAPSGPRAGSLVNTPQAWTRRPAGGIRSAAPTALHPLPRLVRGRRYPLVGTVSMDNITLDVGAGTEVRIGDTATIIGADGGERQTAEELARRIGTINYEIVCGISGRVPREYHRDGERE